VLRSVIVFPFRLNRAGFRRCFSYCDYYYNMTYSQINIYPLLSLCDQVF